jgi:hypothetical protein
VAKILWLVASTIASVLICQNVSLLDVAHNVGLPFPAGVGASLYQHDIVTSWIKLQLRLKTDSIICFQTWSGPCVGGYTKVCLLTKYEELT